MRARAIAGFAVFIAGGLFADCDPGRTAVRTGVDVDAVFVNVRPIPSSIAALSSLTAVRPLPQDRRASSVEMTMYSISATLVSVRHDEDSTYHLLLSDGSRTMIAELPPAGCAQGSFFEMQPVRAKLDERFGTLTGTRATSIDVGVTGTGFFERLGRDAGDAPNGLRLAPITDVTFGAEHALAAPKRRRTSPATGSCVVPDVELTVSQPTACAGAIVALTWQASDPRATVDIDGVATKLPAGGTRSVTVNDSRYFTAHATSSCGRGAETALPLPVSLRASASISGPGQVVQGLSAQLNVNIINASSWTVRSAIGNPMTTPGGTGSGSFTFSYGGQKAGADTLTVSATGGCGTVESSMSMLVTLAGPTPTPTPTPLPTPTPTPTPAPQPQPQPGGLLCCDGSRSPSCFSCSSKSGCCSGHRGVCGCP